MLTGLRRELWMDEALCAQVDPELFFAEKKGDWAKVFRAKMVCHRCPVKNACLAYAIDSPELVGVWGGTTVKQRQALRVASRGQRTAS